MKTLKLSDKRRQWLGKRTVTLRGKPLHNNASLELRAYSDLRRLVEQMTEETQKQITALFKTPVAKEYQKSQAMDASLSSLAKRVLDKLTAKFNDLFSKHAEIMSKKMVNGAYQTSKTNVASSLKALSGGLTIKTDTLSVGMKETIASLITQNVRLIKKIPVQYLSDVQNSVTQSIITGQGLKDLIPAIEKYDGILYRKARQIALDQTRKAYSSLNRHQLDSKGVKEFEWLHTGGSRQPRPLHVAMSGNTYRMDDPPIINKKPERRGYPGDEPNCACIMVPIISFDEGEEIAA